VDAAIVRILHVLERQQQEHVRDEQPGEERRDRPHRPERRNRADQERDADALEEEDEDAPAPFTSARDPAFVRSEERGGLLGGDDPTAPR